MRVAGVRLPAIVREANLFALVGVTATACYAAVTLAAHAWLRLGPMSASVVGYLASVGVSYLGNSLFTFRQPVLHGPQAARFATISLAGFAVNQTITYVCAHLLGWPLTYTLVPVVVVVPATTFMLSKFWAFRPRTIGA